MGNTVRFLDWNIREVGLTRQEAGDLVDVLFRFDGSNFTLCGKMRPGENGPRGLHVYNDLGREHLIYLDPGAIESSFRAGIPVGGNRPASSYKMAVAKVLAHELQHANQHRLHAVGHSSFYGSSRSRYRTRACEREAREFADENVDVIARVLGVEPEKGKEARHSVPVDELEQVVENLRGVDDVTTADIVEELRLSGLNNAVNVGRVRAALERPCSVS